MTHQFLIVVDDEFQTILVAIFCKLKETTKNKAVYKIGNRKLNTNVISITTLNSTSYI